MTRLDPEHVAWCRRLFSQLANGGVWGVPSVGFIFMKRGDMLVLTNRMPHDPRMPFPASELERRQEELLIMTKLHFEAAGIRVLDESRRG